MKSLNDIDAEIDRCIEFINVMGHPNESSSTAEWIAYTASKTTLRTLFWVKDTDMNSIEQTISNMLGE